jgi:hypothetical protein
MSRERLTVFVQGIPFVIVLVHRVAFVMTPGHGYATGGGK